MINGTHASRDAEQTWEKVKRLHSVCQVLWDQGRLYKEISWTFDGPCLQPRVSVGRRIFWVFAFSVMESGKWEPKLKNYHCLQSQDRKVMKRWSEVKSLSSVWLFATPWTVAYQASGSMEFSRQEYWGVGCHFLLQGIFPTQELNLGLPYCRQTLYHLSHQGRHNRNHITARNCFSLFPVTASTNHWWHTPHCGPSSGGTAVNKTHTDPAPV